MDNKGHYQDQLTTQTTEGKRLFVFPAIVKGKWFKRRQSFQWFLLLIFLSLPWLEYQGKPLFLFNIVDRRFFLFGLDLWAHDAPLIFFVLGIAGFSLFLATSLWGRIWCGWACPQTVFIERLFRQIEIWTEGNHVNRIKLQKQEWNFQKIRIKTLKWILYILSAWVVSNSFLAYFVGKDRLFEMISSSPYQNTQSFLIMLFFFALTLFDFTWFREQFCTIVCPYGRFQSVLMDENSMTVTYNQKRGEPRGKLGSTQGDCIDCKKCVNVCPTGIDIRNGSQMECIACTACIDACDDVMEKIKKPKSLIAYANLSGGKFSALNLRNGLYVFVLVILVSSLTVSLVRKNDILIQELRHQSSPYELIKSPATQELMVQNIIKFRLHNQGDKNHSIDFRIAKPDLGTENIKLINPISPFPMNKKQSYVHSIVLQFNRNYPYKEIILQTSKDGVDFKEITVQLSMPQEERE